MRLDLLEIIISGRQTHVSPRETKASAPLVGEKISLSSVINNC